MYVLNFINRNFVTKRIQNMDFIIKKLMLINYLKQDSNYIVKQVEMYKTRDKLR